MSRLQQQQQQLTTRLVLLLLLGTLLVMLLLTKHMQRQQCSQARPLRRVEPLSSCLCLFCMRAAWLRELSRTTAFTLPQLHPLQQRPHRPPCRAKQTTAALLLVATVLQQT